MDHALTVRIIVSVSNEILILQKSESSKLPNVFEFPGGKVDDNTIDPIYSAVRELREETGIILDHDLFNKLSFEIDYSFEVKDTKYKRHVIYFHGDLDKKPEIKVDSVQLADGTSEDKHVGFRWVTMDQFNELKKKERISPNSQIPIELIKNQT